MPRRKKTRTIAIFGRTHYDGCNWYGTQAIVVNGVMVHRTDRESGCGGDYYIQKATEWLDFNGYLPGLVHHANGSSEPLWVYADRMGIPYPHCEQVEVKRARDL